MEVKHPGREELEAGLSSIQASPRDAGVLSLIVRRPAVGERQVVERATLTVEDGLVGDNWKTRGCRLTADGNAHPGMQLNIINARAVALVAQDPQRWALAGDQLYVDLDLSGENLPAGTRLAIGSAVIEITDVPHTGCAKFVQRFGVDAARFVNSDEGRRLNLRGVNARVVEGGDVQVRDAVTVRRRA